MATFLIDLSPSDMQRRLGDALAVYVDAMRYPRGTEDQRASMWLEHTRRHGWKAVAAVDVPDQHDMTDISAAVLAAAPMVGVAYGYCGAPDQWWQQQVVAGLHRIGTDKMRVAELMTSYFELTELHIAPTEARHTCCCPRRRSTAKATGHGGCTGGSGSPTSSAATTSPAIRAHSRSWAGRCHCEIASLAR